MFFKYEAIDHLGKKHAGYIEAQSEESVKKSLTNQSLYVLTVKKAFTSPFGKTHLSNAELSTWCNSVSQLLKSGLELPSVLDILSKSVNDKIAHVSKMIKHRLDMGHTLSQACTESNICTDRIFINTIALSEKTGNLSVSFGFLRNHYEFLINFQAKCKSALYYPVVTLCLATPMIIYFITSLIPTFARMISEMNGKVPMLTRILANIGQTVNNHYAVILFLISLIVMGYIVLNRYYDINEKILFNTPYVKTLVHEYYLTIFFKTLGRLLSQQIPLLTALECIEEFMHPKFKQEITDMKMNLLAGQSLSDTFMASNFLTEESKQLLCISTDASLIAANAEQLSDMYQENLNVKLNTITIMIQPIILAILGFLFLVIIFGGIIPIYSSLTNLL